MRLPELAMTIALLSFCFAALFSFWQLGRRQELVVLRSSVYRYGNFIAYCLCGLAWDFVVAVLDPISACFIPI